MRTNPAGSPRGETSCAPSGLADAADENGERSTNCRVRSLSRFAIFPETSGVGTPITSRRADSSRIALTRAGYLRVRDELHLAQVREPAQRLELDLADALAREAQPLADLLERLRLLVDQAVAEYEHLALPVRERLEREHQRLAAQGDLDVLFRGGGGPG